MYKFTKKDPRNKKKLDRPLVVKLYTRSFINLMTDTKQVALLHIFKILKNALRI